MNNSIPSWTYRYDIDENRNDYIKLINKVFDSGRLLFGEGGARIVVSISKEKMGQWELTVKEVNQNTLASIVATQCGLPLKNYGLF